MLFIAQAAFVTGGVVALAIVLHRRLPAMWRSWVWGALAFVASQAVRTPLLIGVTLFLQQVPLIPRDANPEFVFWFNTLFLSFTAGLFEEPARYLVLRFLGKESRGWREAVMFGAGHGGIEAILIVGGSAIANVFLLMNADALLAQTRAAPAQADALAAQIAALRSVTPFLIGASLFERAFAIMIHIGLSVMVMRAVQERRATWLALAVVVHGVVNTAAIVAQRFGGVVTAEAIVAVCGLALLAWALAQRRSLLTTAMESRL